VGLGRDYSTGAIGYAPILWMSILTTPVLRAITWVSPYTERRQAWVILRQPGSQFVTLFVSQFGNTLRSLSTFFLIGFLYNRYNGGAVVIYKIIQLFDNLAIAQFLVRELLSPSIMANANSFGPYGSCYPEADSATGHTTTLTLMFGIFYL